LTHTVLILRRAQKELARVSGEDYERLCDAVRALGQDPRPPGYLKLTGREGWRIRCGKYRVIYEVDDEHRLVTIFTLGVGAMFIAN
jgi:mRNA interferase RelE/StbE